MEKRILQKMCGIEKDIGSWKNKKRKTKIVNNKYLNTWY